MELRELQLFELKMLKDITKACEENGIEYYLACGTMLGAVRHGGFIPWDDDIDLYMTVKNYKRFRKIGQKILGEKYFVQNYLSEKEYFEQWTKVVANGTTALSEQLKNWNVNHGISIDVFPIIGLSSDPSEIARQQKAFELNRALLSDFFMKATNQQFTVKQRLLYLIPRTIRKFICRLNEKRFLLDNEKYEKTTEIWWKIYNEYPTAVFAEKEKIKFEDGYFYAMKDVDGYLSRKFGDYMTLPPESQRVGHDASGWGKIIYDLNKDYSEYIYEDTKE